MTTQHLTSIADQDLLDAVQRAAASERGATVELLALLGEVDARGLYLAEGCASLFTYCTQVLHLSEHAAYHRIEGARVARRFPRVLELLSSGALTLTTVALLRPIMTPANADAVLDAAVFKSKREIEVLVAGFAPKPDVQTMVRRIPVVTLSPLQFDTLPAIADPQTAAADGDAAPENAAPVSRNSRNELLSSVAPPRPLATPLATDRYLIRLTVSADTHAKLRRAQDLLRHAIPSADPAAVLDRALTMLVDHLDRVRAGHAQRPPQRQASAVSGHSRRIPRAVRRAVWKRDDGRCTFAGPHGRCTETAWLEFHHLVAFARGGPTDAANLTLRCRAHNQFEGRRQFGVWKQPPNERALGLPL